MAQGKRIAHKPARPKAAQARRAALLSSASLIAMVAMPIAQPARATSFTCNPSTVCTIPSGSYSSTAELNLAATSAFTQVSNYGDFYLSTGGHILNVSTKSAYGYQFTNYGVLNLAVGANSNSSTIFAPLFLSSSGDTGSNGSGGGSGPTTATIGGSLILGYNVSTVPGGVYGLYLTSTGGSGAKGVDEFMNDKDPGTAGNAGQVDLALVNANIQVSSASQGASGAAVSAHVKGGVGGSSVEDQDGKPGGATGTLTATLIGSQLRSSGAGIAGLQLVTEGGAGGTGGVNEHSDGASGGFTSQLSLEIATSANGSVVSTNGSQAPAIAVSSLGGAGGKGASPEGVYDIDAGNGGNGGNSGDITVQASGAVHASTTGSSSAGLSVLSQGGVGADGGKAVAYGSGAYSGIGGAGGAAGSVSVALGNGKTNSGDGTLIETQGQHAHAVAVVLAGGYGGAGGVASTNSGRAEARHGGDGGKTGSVSVDIADGVALRTAGEDAYGLVVKSAGGLGGNGNKASGGIDIYSLGGDGGAGGSTGDINVTSAGTISTSGAGSRGILVQAAAGYGGQGGLADGVISGSGGKGGDSGSIGKITILNSGSITTSGDGAQGILAQSLGGGGGAGGSSSGSFFYSAGGDGGNSSDGIEPTASNNGGVIDITQNGSITTWGSTSAGVLAQSIGGGGGDGGTGSGVIVGDGGQGSGGGAGGAVSLHAGGAVTSYGSLSHGLVAHSIGGGGGSGGNAYSTSVLLGASLGGGAGNGGDGGQTAVDAVGGAIRALGTGASGIVSQSIGGGGGMGGAAYSIVGGIQVAIAAAVGGNGGNGGNGGAASVTTRQTSIQSGNAAGTGGSAPAQAATPAVDAMGILAQSIGGGGGSGGGASSLAFAVALKKPTPDPAQSSTVTVTGSFALGGAAGSGGNGGAASVDLGSQTAVETAGAGSHGVMVQSVGGGGGQGGDASALAGTIGSSSQYGTLQNGTTAYSLTFANGAKGGAGGNGGTASLTAGVASTAGSDRVSILTSGDYANGVLVQSIGGGGGNAGMGSTSVTTAAKVTSAEIGLALGGSGGTGGTGGTATAELRQSSSIDTSGSGATGVLAQSIGGGGGNSTGGGLNLGGFEWQSQTIAGPLTSLTSFSLNIGAVGGSGNIGGTVSVDHQGRIVTRGADAPGIVAHSIGGGGGLGGSAGSDAEPAGASVESDNPSAKLAATASDPSIGFPEVFSELTLKMAIGGKGGSGGHGGAVTLRHGGSVATLGDFSPGLFAQSIGGGGGRGGVAVAQGDGNTAFSVLKSLTLNSSIALGGSGGGGTGGDGNTVTLELDGGSSVSTGQAGSNKAGNGFQSFGIFGQSVGGGGGVGADGSVDANGGVFLGAGAAGGGGAAGNGGAVTFRQISGGTPISVRTAGNDAHGLVVQSIGGGGGVGGAGSSSNISAGGGVLSYTPTIDLHLGGNGASGSGGNVLVDRPILDIVTSGRGAYGILGQSVGGGGGFAAVMGSSVSIGQLGGTSSTGNGGTVTVTTDPNAKIVTSGDGAHGIFAQSVGGGGGIAAYTPGPLDVTNREGLPVSSGSGNGGAVLVDAYGTLQVSGANTIGVFAQSIGGGGGFGNNFAGTTGTAASGSSGGAVSVSQSGSLSSLGTGGIGIFAQSQGSSGNGQVSIDLAGTVSVAPDGTGVYVAAGRDNTLTLGSSARIDAGTGVAVRYVGDGSTAAGSVLNVENDGTIIGDILLDNTDGNAAGTVVNNSHNTLSAQRIGAHLVNNGTVVVGMPGAVDGTSVTGDFVQSQTGILRLDANFDSGRIDRLSVAGNADLAGSVDVVAASLLPRRMTFLDVGGSVTGDLAGIRRSVFDFQVAREGNSFSVAAAAQFNRPEFGLNASDSRVAGHFQQIWDNGGAGFGTAFAAIANADIGTYTNLLTTLRSGIANAPAAENLARTQQRLDRTMSCPVFQSGTATLREGECVWAQASGQRFNQGRFDGARGYGDTVFTYAMGGQKQIAPHWFLGFSAAYENSRISDPTGIGLKIDGHSGSVGVALKHEIGPLLLSAALTGSYGTFDSTGMVTLGGTASGSQAVSGFGGRLRAAYTWDLGSFYLRPYLDADIVYTNAGSYSEIGSGLFDRQIAGRSEWALVASPTLEIGARYDLAGDYALRAFARAGASFSSLDSWATTARLIGAPAAIDSFTITKPMDTVYGRVGAGLQLTSLSKRLSLQAEYNGDFSNHSTRHTGTLKLSVGF